jgi:hypothetical protein
MTNHASTTTATRLPRLAFALLALMLAGCSITEPGRAADRTDLARNRQRWASARLHDYEYDYHLLCFCSPEATEQVHVVVRGDHVSAVTRTRDGLPAVNDFRSWPTVEDLFADVERLIDQKADRLEVTYDPTYGYPRSIVVDVYLRAADDESSQTAANLRPLP